MSTIRLVDRRCTIGLVERSSTETKARLLDAATAEFAAAGLAGARVDRIAAGARANKQLIYAYFGGKNDLFDAVLGTHVAGLLSMVDFDPSDLPGYAVRLHDFYVAHPQLVRLARWSELERPEVMDKTPEAIAATEAKIDALRDAMDRGAVDDALAPVELLRLVLTLASGSVGSTAAPTSPLARDALHTAVRRLTTPVAVPAAGL